MEIKVIVIAIATLGALSLLIRRMANRHSGLESTFEANIVENPNANKEIKLPGVGGFNREELDDSQAAEVVATWNLLNPP